MRALATGLTILAAATSNAFVIQTPLSMMRVPPLVTRVHVAPQLSLQPPPEENPVQPLPAASAAVFMALFTASPASAAGAAADALPSAFCACKFLLVCSKVFYFQCTLSARGHILAASPDAVHMSISRMK